MILLRQKISFQSRRLQSENKIDYDYYEEIMQQKYRYTIQPLNRLSTFPFHTIRYFPPMSYAVVLLLPLCYKDKTAKSIKLS